MGWIVRFFIRLVIYAVTITVLTLVLPGIRLGETSLLSLGVVALIFGVVNALIKPIVKFLSCPFILLTLGLGVFLINTGMLYLTAWLSQERLVIDNFLWGLVGGVAITIIVLILERVIDLVDGDGNAPPRRIVEARSLAERRREDFDRAFDAPYGSMQVPPVAPPPAGSAPPPTPWQPPPPSPQPPSPQPPAPQTRPPQPPPAPPPPATPWDNRPAAPPPPREGRSGQERPPRRADSGPYVPPPARDEDNDPNTPW